VQDFAPLPPTSAQIGQLGAQSEEYVHDPPHESPETHAPLSQSPEQQSLADEHSIKLFDGMQQASESPLQMSP